MDLCSFLKGGCGVGARSLLPERRWDDRKRPELAPERLGLDIRREIFMERIIKLWSRVPREMFKNCVDVSGFFCQSMPAMKHLTDSLPKFR